MTATMAGRLLSYDEAAIRAEAVCAWLRAQRSGDDDILKRVFDDEHPSCAVAAYKGLLRGWKELAPERRCRLLDGLLAMAANPAAAAVLMNRLVLFNRPEETGGTPPWVLFGQLLPVVMSALPFNATFIDARLFTAVRSALGSVPASSIVAVCDHWIDWLRRNEVEGRLRDSWSFGVADILLVATTNEPDQRTGRVSQLLSFHGTGATISFIAGLVNHWDVLTPQEQNALLQRVTAGGSDRAWLQGTALTRQAVPLKIQSAILGPNLDLAAPAEVLVKCMPPELLRAALHVYTGDPQPLWWLGIDHEGNSVWDPVIECLARRPDHPLFELAFEEVGRFGDGPRTARVIADLEPAYAEKVLDVLLRLKVGCNGWFMPEAWATLLGLAPDPETHGRWLDRMAAAAPAILEDASDLREWLTEKRDLKPMLDRLRQLLSEKSCEDSEQIETAMQRPDWPRPGWIDP
jgi:hypothetical protein